MGRKRSQKHSLRRRSCFRKLSQESTEAEKKRNPNHLDKYLNPEGELWAQNLTPAQVNVMACLKLVAMERAATLGDFSLAGILDWKTLYSIFTVLEEFSRQRLANNSDALCKDDGHLAHNVIE